MRIDLNIAPNVDLSGVNLSGVNLSGVNLSGVNLSGVNLSGVNLSGADLTDANLFNANLRNANLSGADLSDADLENADLSGAYLRGAQFNDAPIIKDIHQKVYQAASQEGCLNMDDWHTCETTHCRAGWVVTLAGEEGAALEKSIGTSAAAALIYQASDPTLERIPAFYGSNKYALSDMARLAQVQTDDNDLGI